MRLELDGLRLTVVRMAGDPKLYKESAFWHVLKKHVNEKYKTDLVKRLMWRDGHLVDDHQYYLRDRKWNYAITDNQYALRMVYEDYNVGAVTLDIINWEPALAMAFIQQL